MKNKYKIIIGSILMLIVVIFFSWYYISTPKNNIPKNGLDTNKIRNIYTENLSTYGKKTITESKNIKDLIDFVNTVKYSRFNKCSRNTSTSPKILIQIDYNDNNRYTFCFGSNYVVINSNPNEVYKITEEQYKYIYKLYNELNYKAVKDYDMETMEYMATHQGIPGGK